MLIPAHQHLPTPLTLQPQDRNRPPTEKDDTRINSIAFHRTQDLLVSASNDDIITVYDTKRAEVPRELLSGKYGVANICFTHDPNSVIYSSTKVGRLNNLHNAQRCSFLFTQKADVCLPILTSILTSAHRETTPGDFTI